MSAPAASPSSGNAPGGAPSLLPREHGAWGQLAFPLVSGLALGRLAPAALALAAAVVLAFLAHEPLLVVLGQRGHRTRGALGGRAARRLLATAAGALAAGAAGLALAPAPARLALVPTALLGAAAVALALRRLERTTAGEIVIASALATAAAPIALAAGASPRSALSAAVAWVAAFTAATLSVRAILLRARTRGATDRRPAAALGICALVAAVTWAAARGVLAWAAAVALLPVALPALALTVLRVRPQRLTAVGWTIAAASAVALVTLVAGLRLS